MIPAAFDYTRASSLDDAIEKLRTAGPAGKLLAGGHSLVPLMKLRLSEPAGTLRVQEYPVVVSANSIRPPTQPGSESPRALGNASNAAAPARDRVE